MALIKCIRCGNDVSDKATVCPRCGATVGADNAKLVTKSEFVMAKGVDFMTGKEHVEKKGFFLTDTQTGVNYIMIQSGMFVAMCPRYMPDGSLFVDNE